MKSKFFKNGISTKVPNKRIVTIDLKDGTYQFEVFRHINKDEPKITSENDVIAKSKSFRGVVLYGSMRLSKRIARNSVCSNRCYIRL